MFKAWRKRRLEKQIKAIDLELEDVKEKLNRLSRKEAEAKEYLATAESQKNSFLVADLRLLLCEIPYLTQRLLRDEDSLKEERRGFEKKLILLSA